MLLPKRRQPLLAAVAVLLLLVMTACSVVISVTINEGDQTLVVGDTKQLTVTVIVKGNASTEVEWESSTPDVASVTDDGLVTALMPGSAQITATSVADGSKSDTITVTVLEIVGDPDPSISIEKATNGVDADAPTGPILQEGDPVTWTYVVENTGNVTLTDVVVTDNVIGLIACPKDELRPAERMICSASGIAGVGQYANLGTVTGTAPGDETVTDSDPSHYFGEEEEEEEEEEPGTTGASFGDPHLRTMDGRVYTFQAVGDYVLSRSTAPGDDFEVQVRYVPLDTFTRQWSANGAVAAMVEGDQVEVHLGTAGTEIYVNEVMVTDTGPHRLPGGGSIVTTAHGVAVSWPDATTLEARLRPNDIGSITLFLPPARAGLVEGLLGDFDGDRSNDLRIRDGDVVTDTSQRNLYDGGFRDSWSVAQGASPSLFSQGADPFDPDFPAEVNSLADFEAGEVDAARQTCSDRGVIDSVLLDTCALDLLVSGDESWADVAAAIDPSRPAIRILPPVAWVETGAEQQFEVVLTGIEDAGVTWDLVGPGTLVQNGANHAIYTAPESPGMATITVASQALPSLIAQAIVIVADPTAVPDGVVATVSSISGQVVDNPFAAFDAGLYPHGGLPSEDRRLASGTISATGDISMPLPVLDAAQVAGAEKQSFWWCGEGYAFVVGAWIISDSAMDFGPGVPPNARALYLRWTYWSDVDIAASQVFYLYSLNAHDVTCTIDPSVSAVGVDVRIRPGWNVLAQYATYFGEFWQTGEPDLDVPWLGPLPLSE